MSKIGKKTIEINSSTTVEINGQDIKVKGPKGNLGILIHTTNIVVKQVENMLLVERMAEDKETRSCHGLYNTLIRNMVAGVNTGFEKRLTLIGVGYRVQKNGEGLTFQLGFSHPCEIKPIKGITFVTESDTKLIIQGIDKQLVGQVAANIRKLRPPEPYKGKGVRYEDERVIRKAGKAGK